MPKTNNIQKIISHFLKKGILITESILSEIGKYEKDIVIRLEDSDFLSTIKEQQHTTDTPIQTTIAKLNEKISVDFLYSGPPPKSTIANYTRYYNTRFIIQQERIKNNNKNKTFNSIARILQLKPKEKISTIAIIKEIEKSKNDNYFITLEDQTDEIKLIITKNSQIYSQIKTLTKDEIIGVDGVVGDKVIFANNILFPNSIIQNQKPQEKTGIGIVANLNLEQESNISELENTIREKKIKVLFIIGNLIKNSSSNNKPLQEQYKVASKILNKIPQTTQVMIVPGPNDATSPWEPRPPIFKKYGQELYELKNTIMLSSPARITIDTTTVLVHGGPSQKGHIEEIYLKNHIKAPETFQIPIEKSIINTKEKSPNLVLIPGKEKQIIHYVDNTLVTIPDFNKTKETIIIL